MLLLCAFVAGSASVWADYEEVYTFSIKKNSTNNAYASTYDVTIGDLDWNVPGNQYADGALRIGGKNFDSTDRTITGKSSFSEAISKITFNHGGVSSNNLTVNSVKLTVASDAEYKTIIDEVTLTPTIEKNTDGSFDFKPTTPLTQWASGSYYKIAINCKCTDTSSNRYFLVKSIVFYKTVTKTATTTAIDATGITNTNVATGTAAGSLSASVTAGGSPVAGATVSWSSSEEGVATIAEDGTVTLVAAGETTITASYAGDATYSTSSDTYVLTVTDPRVAAGLAYAESNQTVKVGEVLDAPTLTNPNSLTVTYSSADETIATVDTDGNVTGVKIGSTTITASFAGNSSYSAGSASYTIQVKKATPAGQLFYEGLSGYTSISDNGTVLSTTSANLDSEDWNSFAYVYPGKVVSGDTDGHLKFGSGSNAGTAVTKAIALTGSGKLTYKVQRYDSSNTGNLKISVTGATASGDVDVTGTGAWVEKTVYLTGATGSVIITFATTSSNKRIRVDDITVTQVTTAPVTISAAEYATFSSPYALDFSTTGITVYTATANTTSVTLTEVTQVPAGAAVVLYKAGADGTAINVPVIASADALTGNELLVSDGSVGNGVYVLANKTNGVGFYKWNGGSLPEGKVYLPAPATAPEFLGFALGGETTDISEKVIVNSEKFATAPVYNLNGQRVMNPTKGLFIMNGKKVIIK